MAYMPERITLDGTEYVRADLAARPAWEAPEPSYSIRELADATGFPARTLYDAAGRGELAAILPNGTRRGMRVTASAWAAYVASRATA